MDGRAVEPEKIVADSIKSWESFIVGFFIGKRLAYPMVRKHLENKWKLGEPLIMKHERNFFFIKIESEEIRRTGPILELVPSSSLEEYLCFKNGNQRLRNRGN